ncbi:hypothetical protein D3C80_2127310 [compost metagenome]
MGVGVDKAGQQHLLLQVDQLGAGLFQAQHLGVGADGEDLAVLDGHGLLQRLAGNGGVDLAAMQDQFRGGDSFC